MVEIAGILVVSVLAAWQTIGDWDFPWHLRVGELIVTGGTIPRSDVLSWSFDGQPWTYRDAGSQIILYISWALAGFAGVAAVRAAAVAAFCLTLRSLVAGPMLRASIPVALAGISILASPSAWLPRPLLAGTVLLPLLLAAQIRTLQPDPSLQTRPASGWWLQAAIVALWFQLHRSAVIGLAFVLAFTFFATIVGLVGNDRVAHLRRTLTHVAPAIITAALSGLCTVNGVELYRSTLALQSNEALQSAISEWQPMSWSIATTHYPWLLAIAGMAIIASSTMVAHASVKRDWGRAFVCLWPLLVLGVLVWQAAGAVRHAGLLAAASAVALAVIVNRLAELRSWRRPIRPALAAVFGIVIGAAAVVASLMHTWGSGFAPDRFPQAAISFAAEHRLGDRVHNSFVYGGYVTWQGAHAADLRVLVDGRNETVYPIPFYMRCSAAQRDLSVFTGLHTEYPADWVLADNTPGREDFTFLFADPAWSLIYWSDQALVYVPSSRVPNDVTPFRFIDPADPVASLGAALQRAAPDASMMAALSDELTRILDASPDSFRSISLRLLFLHSTGQQNGAEFQRLWLRVRQLHGEHPSAAQLAGIVGQSL